MVAPVKAKFPPFAPDITSLMTGVSSLVQNVVPRFDGYGPFPSLKDFTKTLPDTCRGYFFARKSDGTIAIFAGTLTDLYLLNNTDFSWTKVSSGGGPYGGLSSNRNWEFAQFNDTVIAVQQNVVPQAFTLASSTTFGALGGSPPQAGAVAVIGFFLVLTEILGNPKRVQWSDLGIITTWTAGVGLSDYQDMSDGGNCHAVSGGDSYGVIFQDSAVRTLTYAPGSPTVFQIYRIGKDETLGAKYSIINIGTRIFYLSSQGFKMIEAGGAPTQIGKGIVDDFFKGDWDSSNDRLMVGASDPTQTRVYFAYKSTAGTAGLMDKILVFDPAIGKGGSWSLIVGMSLEYITTLAKPGLTLENMDALAAGAISITNAANNGAGKVRLTLNPGTSNPPFTIVGQNTIEVQGVTGTTEANGGWQFQAGSGPPANGCFVIIDSTHIDLGVAFSNAYVSGGAIGGSLDAITFSFDNISNAAQAQLSGIDSSHAVGFFVGSNLEAYIETDEQDNDGNMVFIDGCRPITDCDLALCSIGTRANAQQTSVSYTTEALVDNTGQCNLFSEGRYNRVRLHLPAGAPWTYARMVQVFAKPAGEF